MSAEEKAGTAFGILSYFILDDRELADSFKYLDKTGIRTSPNTSYIVHSITPILKPLTREARARIEKHKTREALIAYLEGIRPEPIAGNSPPKYMQLRRRRRQGAVTV